MRALDVVGSDVRNYLCPKCGSNDRERHLKLYFDALGPEKYIRGKAVLHFAPETHFSKYIEAFDPARHVRGDLFPANESIEPVNMMKMNFQDGEFDLVIANHVLEHVSDISNAMQELWRVLKPGGFALLQTPYSRVLLSTFEDLGIVEPEARLEAYGQADHVRLFGRNIFEFLSSFGFKSNDLTHKTLLGEIDATTYGVNRAEPLFLFERCD